MKTELKSFMTIPIERSTAFKLVLREVNFTIQKLSNTRGNTYGLFRIES